MARYVDGQALLTEVLDGIREQTYDIVAAALPSRYFGLRSSSAYLRAP